VNSHACLPPQMMPVSCNLSSSFRVMPRAESSDRAVKQEMTLDAFTTELIG
jgi:hypothetical protein